MHMCFRSPSPAAGCPWNTASSGVSSAPCASSSSSTSSFSSSPSGGSPRSSPASTQTSPSYTKSSQSACLFVCVCLFFFFFFLFLCFCSRSCKLGSDVTQTFSTAQANTALSLSWSNGGQLWELKSGWKECESFVGENGENVFIATPLLSNGVLLRGPPPPPPPTPYMRAHFLLHSVTVFGNKAVQICAAAKHI